MQLVCVLCAGILRDPSKRFQLRCIEFNLHPVASGVGTVHRFCNWPTCVPAPTCVNVAPECPAAAFIQTTTPAFENQTRDSTAISSHQSVNKLPCQTRLTVFKNPMCVIERKYSSHTVQYVFACYCVSSVLQMHI